ncbi:hypothetical protein RB195_010707 [Necator americanus]|uniref:Uncharacterized protein n=1 Tax=Necator americanus TaxID=51031 RepID=A0ABR1D082_NECAM
MRKRGPRQSGENSSSEPPLNSTKPHESCYNRSQETTRKDDRLPLWKNEASDVHIIGPLFCAMRRSA